MNLPTIGLVVIAVAWVIQLLYSLKGNKEIHAAFVICYMIGVAALVVSDYLEKSTLSYFELLTFIAAGIVLIKIRTPKK